MTLTFNMTDHVSKGKNVHTTIEVALRVPDQYEDNDGPLLHIVSEQEAHTADRHAALKKLVALSTDDSSLDWELLSRVNVEAWGADDDE